MRGGEGGAWNGVGVVLRQRWYGMSTGVVFRGQEWRQHGY